jgi:TonB family protein
MMKFRILAAFMATTVLCGHAMADEGKVVPETARRVTPAEKAAVFPKAAFDQKISGSATLDCTADDQGREIDCRIIKENPPGLGFGDAAMAVVAKERVKTKDGAGASIVGRRFESSFSFLAPGDADPDWAQKPTLSAMAAAYPKAARKRPGLENGGASIKCDVSVEGFLQHCTVVSEKPEGMGFGAAAQQLSPQFRMTPKIRGGKPVPGGEVTIPIIWKGLPNEVPQAPASNLVLDPPWESAPVFAQVRAAWPADAKGQATGQVVLRCRLSKTGVPSFCLTITETPAGHGFAKAARGLLPYFKVRFAPEQAKSLGEYEIDVPFLFRDPAGPDTRKITAPTWTRQLTADGMALVYPKTALAAGVLNGGGVVNCAIDTQGELVDCRVQREYPANLDFGAAALQAVKQLALNPWSKEGDPLDTLRLSIPIRFNWTGAAPMPVPAKP